jgi:hypothetical protein
VYVINGCCGHCISVERDIFSYNGPCISLIITKVKSCIVMGYFNGEWSIPCKRLKTEKSSGKSRYIVNIIKE